MFTGIIEEVGTVKGFAINGSSGRIKERKPLGTESGAEEGSGAGP